jgi:hypothetical protein
MYLMSSVLVCNYCHQTNKLFKCSYNKKYDKHYPQRMCRECSSKYAAEWIKNNKERALEIARKVGKKRYQTEKRKLWLKERDKRRKPANWDRELTSFVLQEAHALTKLRESHTGVKWHVDHTIPLQGQDVSGLHVWNNLQVLPATVNLRKGNRWSDEDQRDQESQMAEDSLDAIEVLDSDDGDGLEAPDEGEPFDESLDEVPGPDGGARGG